MLHTPVTEPTPSDEHEPGGGRLAGVPRSWLAGASIAALAIFGAGGATGAIVNSGADEQARLQAQLTDAEGRAAASEQRYRTVSADRDRLSRAATAVSSRERRLDGRQTDLDQRQVGLDQREAELKARAQGLDQREAEIGQAEQAAKRSEIPGDGTFLVGQEISPGRYRTPGGGGLCYVARLKNLTGGVGSIIDNQLSEGPIVIDVRSSDEAVQTRGCPPLAKIG